MNLSDAYKAIHCFGMNDLIPLTCVISQDIKTEFNERGIKAGYTRDEFTKEHPVIDPEKIYFGNEFSPFVYWDKTEHIMFQVPAMYDGRHYLYDDKEHTLERDILAKKEYIQNQYSRHSYGVIFDMLNNTLAMGFFDWLISDNFIPQKYLYETFLYGYTQQDYGSAALSIKTIQKIISSKTESQHAHTNTLLTPLPELIKIYRGEGDGSTPLQKAISWTTDINVANFFAARIGSAGKIYTATVHKSDILESIPENGEAEILVPPDKVMLQDTVTLCTNAELFPIFNDVSDIYQSYRNMLKTDIYYLNTNSQGHDKLHGLRVLFLALAIGSYEHVSRMDFQRLATATVYHDSKRNNDEINTEHGKRARVYYESNRKRPDEIVSFLIEYHCLPDEDGYAYIETHPSLKKMKGRTIRLYKIFKDADALDRVRFGIRDIDLHQLRLARSKSMTLVANAALNYLEL